MCVVTASFAPAGNIFLSGSLMGSVIEWDAISGARRRVLLEPEVEAPSLPPRPGECMRGSPLRCVRFSPAGRGLRVVATDQYSSGPRLLHFP
jgi:hypothetical protein